MATSKSRYGAREVADVTFYDLSQTDANGNYVPVFFLDTLKMSDLTLNAKTVWAVGGKGANQLLGWDYGRTAQFDVQDALLNPTAVSSLTGQSLTTGVAQTVTKREVLTAAGTSPIKVTLSEEANANSIQVFTTTDGYEQTSLPTTDYTSTANVNTPPTTDITFTSGVTAGQQVIVYYTFQSSSTDTQLIEVDASKFPGYYKIVGDTVIRNDDNGLDEPFQIVIWKAKLLPSFKFTLQAEGNAPTVFDFKLEAVKPTSSDLMISLIKYS